MDAIERMLRKFLEDGWAGQYIQLAGRPSVNRKRRVDRASQME
jgi:hypothetical protein